MTLAFEGVNTFVVSTPSDVSPALNSVGSNHGNDDDDSAVHLSSLVTTYT